MRPVPVVFLRLAFSPQLTAQCQLRASRIWIACCSTARGHVHFLVLAAG
jgi:hypothetical protein